MRPPPDFFISLAPCWQQKNVAFRFTEWMKSQSCSVISRIDACETRRIVHQPIEPSHAAFHFGEEARDLVDVFQIGPKEFGPAAFRGRASRLGFGIVIVDGHARALAGQPQSDATADALSRPGDEDDFIRHKSGAGLPACAGTLGLCYYAAGSPCTSISSGSIPGRAGSGNRPETFAQVQ